MPAKTVTVKSKTKTNLKKQVSRRIKELGDKGLIYITQGYDHRKVKRIKDGYQIDISVHS